MERITESYVSFETSQLLKKAGFSIRCESWYDSSGCKNGDYKSYQRPTQQLAARWIREVCHISIILTPAFGGGWILDLIDLEKHQYILCNKQADTIAYESALEAGLQECLDIIIKNKA